MIWCPNSFIPFESKGTSTHPPGKKKHGRLNESSIRPAISLEGGVGGVGPLDFQDHIQGFTSKRCKKNTPFGWTTQIALNDSTCSIRVVKVLVKGTSILVFQTLLADVFWQNLWTPAGPLFSFLKYGTCKD